MKEEDNNFELNDIITDDKFLWNVITLIVCFIGGTLCAIVAIIYVLFFK